MFVIRRGLLTLILLSPFVAGLTRPVSAMAQTPSAISGVVVDPSNGILTNAPVELRSASGALLQSTATDANGTFRFDRVAPGRYQIRATSQGFAPTTVTVTADARTTRPLRITLPLAGMTEEITVGTQPLNPAANSDAVVIDQSTLDSLPVFDRDPIATLSRFLDAGSIATGGVTVVVNGMEVNGLDVSASAIQQIKINQDPYSAEYSRPGRGRIEVLTKPGSQEYHGELNTVFRDATLNARNAFAVGRPPEHRRIFEGALGGPLGSSRKASFMISADADTDDQEAVVFAQGQADVIRATVPQTNGHVLASGSIMIQRSKSTTISIRSSYENVTNENRGVGGTTLASAGTSYAHREAQVTYGQQTLIGQSLLNQFQILAGHEREPTTSVSQDVGIVVAGAFTGGGAQNQLLRTESHVQASESLTWTHGHHLVQAGFQVPDWSLRGFDDSSNFGGTFYFSSLQTYAAAQPYAFVQQRGNGHVVFLEKVLGAYVKDDWQVSKSFTASLGLRYDWANYFPDNNNLAPRGSFAFSPGGAKTNVIRGGAGVFYDKPGPVSVVDTRHFAPGGLQRIVLTNPAYPNPFQSGSAVSSVPPSIVQFAPDIRVPYTVQYSLGIEHQLHATTIAVTYLGSQGYDLFRSRDINAPQPPAYAVRPNPAYGVVRQIESAGRLEGNSLQVTWRGKLKKWFNGQMQYTLSRTLTDTGGLSWFPANDYDLSGEWARADFDRRHQFLVLGRISPGRVCDVGVSLTLQSGTPYNETLGTDLFNNGRGNARPAGVSRNTLQGAGYADFDVRLSREVTFAKGTPRARTITFGLDAFNLMNRINYGSYVATLTSPLFGQPVTARPPRQLQLSARLTF